MVRPLFPVAVTALFVVSLHVSRAQASPISFFKEEIVVTICAPDTIEVRGHYWFRNSSSDSVSTIIFYPFPVHQDACFPYYIAVKKTATSGHLAFRSMSNGIEWPLRLPANAVASILVIYRQTVKKGVGEYIVSTTKQWGMPLQTADFCIRVPKCMTLSFWSFRADGIDVKDDTITYRARINDFFPDSEMFVHWKW